MKKYIFLLLALFLLNSLSAKKTIIQSYYQKTPIKIDGNIDDWGDMMIFDEKTSIVSDISNDHEYIYVKIRIANFYSISRLMRGGFTVWFNDEGKSRPKIGIAFPIVKDIPQQDKQNKNQYAKLTRSEAEQLQAKKLENFNMKFTSGLASINVLDKDLNVIKNQQFNTNDEGLCATLLLKDADLFVYEARIPLDIIFDNKEEFLAAKKKSFCLGYEFGKFVVEEFKNKPGSNLPRGNNQMGRYNYTARRQVNLGDRSKIPAVYTWYKKVYLSNE